VELRHLRSFVAVARQRSFTRAARTLGIAQPALSQQIGALERDLGVVLVVRDNRTIGLTEAGAALLVRADRILLETQSALDEMASHAGLHTGKVRLGCALQSLVEGRLATLLAGFQMLHPGLQISLHERHTSQVLELLGRGDIDLGLLHLGRADPSAPLVGASHVRPEIALVQLYREPLVLIVGPGHRLAARKKVSLVELRDERFIAFKAGSTVRRLVRSAARESGFAPHVVVSTASLGTVRALVSAGLGVAFVPRTALDVPSGPLHAVDVEPHMERVVTLARNTIRYETPAAAALFGFIKSELVRGTSWSTVD
jgi:DNA-binding transcriptional LysR family regulator